MWHAAALLLHPGHGTEPGWSWLHYLAGEHLALPLAVAALAAGVLALRRRAGSRS